MIIIQKKVALYVRVSTEEQAEHGYSIDAQLNTLRAKCNETGKLIVEEYIDRGISGKSLDKRFGLQKLLLDARQNKFDEVLVWKTSRLARNTIDLLNIVEELNKMNISFRSYSESFESETSMGKLALQIMAGVAEYERNNIVENVKLGMIQRAKEGKWNGGSVLGYLSKDKALIINEEEAIVVRHIFNLYINGNGYKAIANRLNYEGYKTKRKKAFSINSVRTIITNPIYAGFIQFNKNQDWNEKRRKGKNSNPILIKGIHKPIIESEVWEKAQTILKQKSHKPVRTFTGSFPLTTLLRCPVCNQGMIGHRIKKSKNSSEYIRYYQCGNFHYKGSSICKSNLVNAELAENYVFNKIEELTSSPTVLKEIIERVNGKIDTHKEPIRNSLEYINNSIRENKKSIHKLLTIIETTDNVPRSILQRMEELEDKQIELCEQQKKIEEELNKPAIKKVSYEHISKILVSFSKVLHTLHAEKLKDLLHTLINEITVCEGNSPSERKIKDIQLFFDLSSKEDYVLTYGTVPPD